MPIGIPFLRLRRGLRPKTPPLEDHPKATLCLLQPKRLKKIMTDALTSRLENNLLLCYSRADDNGNALPSFIMPQLVEKIQSTALRKEHIQYDDCRRHLLHELPSMVRAARLQHFYPHLFSNMPP